MGKVLVLRLIGAAFFVLVGVGCDDGSSDGDADADVDADVDSDADADESEDGDTPDGDALDADQPDGDSPPPPAVRRGFIVIHCDPHEILQLHGNLTTESHDYDRDGAVEQEDMWLALMDLVELADERGHRLTLQMSPPWIEYLATPACDLILSTPREYPAGSGSTHGVCRELVFAWQANGHELSVHHHGPNHDPTKFDGYTSLAVWDTNRRRPCLVTDASCDCPGDECFWCAPPDSELICERHEDPPSPIGVDPEWRGRVEGPDGMWARIEGVLGEDTVTSICMNHGDEVADMPVDPDVLYTTQGGGFDNDPATYPLCVGYDVDREYHDATRYTWFFRHGPVNSQAHLTDLRALVEGMGPAGDGTVVGIVFHVNDFARSHLAPAGTPYGGVHRELLGFLADPDGDEDVSDEVSIETLSGLLSELAGASAPDPCSETCFSLDTSAETSIYTIPVPRPESCGG